MATTTQIPAAEVLGATAEHTELRKGALKLLDSVVIAVSSTAPAYSIATSLAALVAVVALAGPAAIWVGFIPVMGVAIAYYYLNRIDPNCGASYSWVGKALNPQLGFLNGWVQIVASLLFMSFAAPQAGQATLQLLNAFGLTGIGPLNLDATSTASQGTAVALGLALLAIVTYMVVVGIQVAARFQYVLLALEYFIVVGFAIAGFFHGGGTPFSWSWLDPRSFGSLTALAGGVVVSVFFYWGWDTAANINEESANSRENPGRAGMLGMVALLFIFLLAAVSIQMVLTPKEIAANSATTLTAFANKIVGQPIASLAILAFLSSTIATVQTTLLPSARTAFSMGRDGVIGGLWARVHPVWKTPAVGTIVLALIAAIAAVLSLPLGQLGAVVTAGVTSIGVLVAFYYGMAAIACAVLYRRALTRSVKGLIFAGIVPVLSGLILFVLAGYLLYQNWTSTDSIAFDATNGKFLALVPVVIILAGIPALIWSQLRQRSGYYRMPRVTADPDALTAHTASRAS
ncbi:MAG TPA: APC family permease [Candidatus Limnocylindrales bacterium]|nr:APC family permease [Candidatus Limnocylindrales bacterium]